jgi:hypothetical protein
VFDQKIAPARAIGEQRMYFIERLRIDLAALSSFRGAAAAASEGWMRPRTNVHRHLPTSEQGCTG